MTAAYLVGLPGAGKTSLMRSITAGTAFVPQRRPFAHLVYLGPDGRVIGVELGARHEAFGGTDRLSMSVHPKALAFVETWRRAHPGTVIVGEGDRLATARFLDALGGQLVWLDVPTELAQVRRTFRNASHPSPAWLAGRRTKLANLLAARDHVRLDGTLVPSELRAQAIALVPAFAALAA